MKLRDAVVVITGASSGIGRASALLFALKGANVVLTARREQLLDEVARECERCGVQALAVPGDTSDAEAVEQVGKAALREFGRIDVWVNNAGVLQLGSLEETPPEVYRRVIEVNFFGYVHGSRVALAAFRRQGYGILINNGSLSARMPAAYENAYAASKYAVYGMTQSLRQETLLDEKIDICFVAPAGVDTPILLHAGNHTGVNVKPLYPLVGADDVARVIVRLAEHPEREVVVGRLGKFQATMQRIAPSLQEKVIAWSLAKARGRADPKPITDGNVFEPMEEGAGASGDLRTGRRALRTAAVAAVVLAFLVKKRASS